LAVNRATIDAASRPATRSRTNPWRLRSDISVRAC
jgi:hypothetical protein